MATANLGSVVGPKGDPGIVQSIAAGSNVTISGTPEVPVVNVPNPGVGDMTKAVYDPNDYGLLQAFPGAGPHNAIYRGKDLGTEVTAEQYAAIADGSFTDLYIGDYWVISGVTYRIAAFDYYLRAGDTDMTTHHITLVPDVKMYTGHMNATDITTGGYYGSAMYTTGLAQAKTTINAAFGAAHILNHRQYLTNAVTSGRPSGGSWYDSTVELMTEQNVYGGKVFAPTSDGVAVPLLYTIDKSQYPLFTFRPDMIFNRQNFWLRDVVSDANFALVNSTGNAHCLPASFALGVRPAFSIKS